MRGVLLRPNDGLLPKRSAKWRTSLYAMVESPEDSSREHRLLELFLMGMLTQPELEAELARPEKAEDSAGS